MYIAILDDDLDEIYRIQNIILNFQGSYRIRSFQKGKDLLEAVNNEETFDLLLCDIFMQEENGIDVARQLRAVSPQTEIAFITCSRDHAVEAFSMDALHYLIKPVCKEDITQVFARMEKKSEPRHILALLINRMMHILYQDEIIRVENQRHNTIITCSNGSVYSIRKPFHEIDAMLDASFIQVKKGLTLNMHHITKMSNRECETRDGLTFLLRRDQANEIRERYFDFVHQELIKMK